MEKVDALIIGSGPVGLCLGICLLRQGKSVTIVDRLQVRDPNSKAIVMTSASFKTIQPFGILENLSKYLIPMSGVQYFIDNKPVCTAEFQTIPFNPNDESGIFPSANLTQNYTEKALEETFLKLGGKMHWGFQFDPDSFVDEGASYKVTLKPSNTKAEGIKPMVFHTTWLFGCDGPRSAVREFLGIKFVGERDVAEAHLREFTMRYWPYSPPTVVGFFFGRYGFSAFGRIKDKTVRCMATTLTAMERFQADFDIVETHWSTTFKIHFLLAESYGRDRIWLAGDAVHQFSPIGGNGLNCGFEDAVVLAKCVETGDLASYEKVRKPPTIEWLTKNRKVLDMHINQTLFGKIRRWLFVKFIQFNSWMHGDKFALKMFQMMSSAQRLMLAPKKK